MNYHIMADATFIDWFIGHAEAVAPNNNTFIITVLKENARFTKSDKAIFAPLKSIAFQRIMNTVKDGDKVWVHWVWSDVQYFVNRINKKIEIGVFFWGGDFFDIPEELFANFLFDKQTLVLNQYYQHICFHPFQAVSIKDFFKRLAFKVLKTYKRYSFLKERHLFMKRLTYFCNFIPQDWEWVKSHYPTNAEYAFFFYGDKKTYGIDFQSSHAPFITQKTVSTIYILLGNNAGLSNNHIEALTLLEKYQSENIKIVLPMSYGTIDNNFWYRDKIIQHAEAIFGKEKVLAITSIMPLQEYQQLLDKIDIVLMPQNRQQGVGNISFMLARGKKVYLKTNNTFSQTLSENNIHFEDILNIENENFSEFSKLLSPKQVLQNFNNLSNMFDENKKNKQLKRLLGNN